MKPKKRNKKIIRKVKFNKEMSVAEALGMRQPVNPPVSMTVQNSLEYDPDSVVDDLATPVMNPVIAFHEALRASSDKKFKMSEGNPFKGRNVKIAEAYVFEAKYDRHGRILPYDKQLFESIGVRWPANYRIHPVHSNEDYLKLMESSRQEWDALPVKSTASKNLREEFIAKMKEAKLIEDDFGGELTGPFDPNQFTEFTPIMGGPFNKQLYLTDYLRMHALAFEAWNHNPLAKRIVELFAQYTFGRRFKVRIKDKRKEKAWKDFDAEFAIRENVSKYWIREYCIYGEIMVNRESWQLIDPSTVWDIITDPDNLRDVYYYYQSYPTAYQMFTGYRVAGEPGSEKVPSEEYIVRQVPAHKVKHMKTNCVSNEKRGRSLLFPVLGWLKRVKDLYNAVVVRQWLMSCFIWDDLVKGNAADISAHASQYATMPKTGSTFVHNESVERKAMPAIDTAGGRNTGAGIGEEIISFIAVAVGIPKEFFNVQSSGGGSRATALTSAEPFTKVIEDVQATFEALLIDVAQEAFSRKGLEYEEGDVEFIFPSVTKDTTSETIKNIQSGEAMGYISKQTAAEMYAGEMNITNYDFEKEQGRIGDESEQGLNKTGSTPLPPAGRFGGGSGAPGQAANGDGAGVSVPNADDGDDESPIHGKGKVSLSRSLKRL